MIEQYIGKEITCECGRTHKSKVQKIVIHSGVIQNELPAYLTEKGYTRLTVVCDNKSYAVAGKDVCTALEKAKIGYKLHLFTAYPLSPDDAAVGNLVMGCDPDCQLILAVGSGVINDLCRYVSAVMKKPFCTVGTAPSMDGYISGGSALVFNSLKITFETHTPDAVFFDPNILANAPRDMIASGVGDLLGKINCLQDWKLANMITKEWRCGFISDIVQATIDKTVEASEGIKNGNPDAVATLIEALLLSGVCMDYAGNSRPASGCEHHLSHFWEMRFLLDGIPAVFHGTKVGIGTIIALKAYEYVATLNPDFEKIRALPRAPFDEWEKTMRIVYKKAADDVIHLEKSCGKNSQENLQKRLDIIEKQWANIKTMAQETTKAKLVGDILKGLNAPTLPEEVGADKTMALQAILYCKELRNRYTVLQLLWDLGELENFANSVL